MGSLGIASTADSLARPVINSPSSLKQLRSYQPASRADQRLKLRRPCHAGRKILQQALRSRHPALPDRSAQRLRKATGGAGRDFFTSSPARICSCPTSRGRSLLNGRPRELALGLEREKGEEKSLALMATVAVTMGVLIDFKEGSATAGPGGMADCVVGSARSGLGKA